MNFELDEVAAELVGVAETTLDRLLPPETVAGETHEELGHSPQAWQELLGAGLAESFLPESAGGFGAGEAALAAVLKSVGAHGDLVPALPVSLGLLPLIRFGGPDHQELISATVAGDALLTAAIREPGGARVADVSTAAVAGADGVRITGAKSHVEYAATARAILVPARIGDDIELFVVDPQATGVSITEMPTPSHVPAYTITLTDVPAGPSLGAEAARYLDLLAQLGLTAITAGGLSAAIKVTAEHISMREQFGRKIAQFQAVAMQMADAYLPSTMLDNLLTAASWQLETGDWAEAAQSLAAAELMITDHVRTAFANCLHVSGGTGLDRDFPLHRYFTNYLATTHVLGGHDAALERAGELALERS